MANYYASSRTNYVKCSDKEGLIKSIKPFGLNAEFDCLTLWVYVPDLSYKLIGYNFLDSELENIDVLMKEIEEVINDQI